MTNNNEIIIYQSEDGQTQVDVRMENETVWLTQAQMAELFQTDRTSIVRHINNIYKVEELDRESTCAKFAQVQMEGNRTVTRHIPIFNLDMIISVGYRVNAKRGVKFRQWANRILKEYLTQGYAVNAICEQGYDIVGSESADGIERDADVVNTHVVENIPVAIEAESGTETLFCGGKTIWTTSDVVGLRLNSLTHIVERIGSCTDDIITAE